MPPRDPKFDDPAFLLHIRDAIERIRDYTTAGEEAFLTSPIVQDAVIRNLEIIGEAARRLSDDAKRRSAAIPWRKVAGLRDRLIHEYFRVNLAIVWGVVRDELPDLHDAVTSLLSEPSGGDTT